MKAFMLVYAKVADDAKFQAYVAALQPILKTYGAKLLARALHPEILEGDWPWQTAGVLEFPSLAAAQDMWRSPDYQHAKSLRAGISEFQVVLLPALEP